MKQLKPSYNSINIKSGWIGISICMHHGGDKLILFLIVPKLSVKGLTCDRFSVTLSDNEWWMMYFMAQHFPMTRDRLEM